MSKKDTQSIKNFQDKLLPLVATLASILAAFYYFFELASIKEDNLQFIVGIAASFLGIFLSYFILKFLRQKREGNIFISYSHSDKVFVDKLIQSLKFKRFNIIYDEEVIKIGDNIKDSIIENIKKSDAIIMILSSKNKKDDYINYEIKIALENNKKILPVIIDPNTNIPLELQELKYADFSKDYEKNVQDLAKGLVTALDKKSSS